MKKSTIFMPLIIGIAIAIGIGIGSKLNFTDFSDRVFVSNSKKDKLNRLIDYIDYEYLEDVNTDSIVDITVNEILSQLDPHSTYIPKDQLKDITNTMNGGFIGIGIRFNTVKDTIIVVRTIKNSPSEAAGLTGGDRIITVNNDSVINTKNNYELLASKIKGPIGTSVNLGIYRPSNKEILNIKVDRGEIPINSIEASYMLNSKLGYIKLKHFSSTTYSEFKKALTNLKSQGAVALTLDLRDNPGGFISAATKIADDFLKEGKLIVYTKDKQGAIVKSIATKNGSFEDNNIFVLMNENSASASEIVAGALQDNDKGTIIGRRSYGKGLVQREMKLGDGSAIRLTVSKYYTPTGRSIQRPYTKGEEDDYYNNYQKRLESGELSDASKIKVADSLKFTTPKGKIVYGGGGIIPDIFVPTDKKRENLTILFIERRGLTSRFVFEWLDKNREQFNAITLKQLKKSFIISDKKVEEFEAFFQQETESKFTFNGYYDTVKLYLKANIAQQMYGQQGYYEVLNTNDIIIAKAIEASNK